MQLSILYTSYDLLVLADQLDSHTLKFPLISQITLNLHKNLLNMTSSSELQCCMLVSWHSSIPIVTSLQAFYLPIRERKQINYWCALIRNNPLDQKNTHRSHYLCSGNTSPVLCQDRAVASTDYNTQSR